MAADHNHAHDACMSITCCWRIECMVFSGVCAYRRGENLAGAKFGTVKCGTAKLYHILPWYFRAKATFFYLPNLCIFSLHYKVPRV